MDGLSKMAGLNQQNDVEIAEVSDVSDQFELIPVSNDGVRAIRGCLGCEAEMGTPVRVTDDQYRKFSEYVRRYARNRGRRFSMRMRPRFRGQKQVDPSDLNLISEPDLPSELQERLSYDSRFLYLEEHNFSVLLARYGPPASGQLYKVTNQSQTPERSSCVSVGTLDYYRNTVDKNEASFTSDNPEMTMRTLDGKVLARPGDFVSASFLLNPGWIYCTTMVDRDGLTSDQSAWSRLEATPIVSSTEHFAYMLGATFGIWSKPRLRDVYAYLESVEVLRAGMNGIIVVHGPVRYMDAGERNEYLGALTKQNSPLKLLENVFTKSDEFAWEREYRFAIFGWGPPLQDHVVMPVTKALADCYGGTVPVESLSGG